MSTRSKKVVVHFWVILLIFAVVGIAQEEKSSVPVIPVEVFFKNPDSVAFKLSPAGDYLSYLKPWENRFNIYIRKIGQETETRITHNSQQSIRQYDWINNERLIYLFDAGGDENLKLYSVNVDGSQVRVLSSFKTANVSLINKMAGNPDEILVGIGKKAYLPQDVYRINIFTGKKIMVAENNDDIEYWLSDHNGQVRVGVSTEKEGRRKIFYRSSEKDKFKEVYQTEFGEITQPVLFTFDNQAVYAKSNRLEDTLGLYKFNIAKGELAEKIFSHPQVDIIGGNTSKKRKVLTDIVFCTDMYDRYFLDAQQQQFYTKLEKLLPQTVVDIISTNDDETLFLIRTFSDRNPGSYIFFDSSSDKLLKLCDLCPWLKEEWMAEMKSLQFQARDGLLLHGYLTLPKGIKAANLPVLIMPHGGPWSRDFWGFDPEVQFFANRGYAVCQINFRGSSGYGRKFLEMGFKQWGQSMQNDLTDGVQWLIKEGIADPKRVGIYGASYGGYAALAGVAFTPDLYACAVDFVGISDLVSFSKWSTFLHRRVGHPDKDEPMLKKFSPFYQVNNIKVPLFIAQGANDPRVLKEQSDKMVEALKKKGVKVVYMVKENEGHGFHNIENKIDFFKAVEIFLSEHLGGRKAD